MTWPDAAKVHELVLRSGFTKGEVARMCAARSDGNFEAWRRWLAHLGNRRHVDPHLVDVVCAVLGSHLSRFDPIYEEAVS